MIDQYGHEANEKYTFVEFNVAGVTFKNGRRSRQTILRRIYWKDEPYKKVDSIKYVDTEWEGEPAIEVWVENKTQSEMIGYVPKEEVKYFHDNFDNIDQTLSFNVYGGGEGKNFGAEIRVRFINKEKPILKETEREKAERERREREAKEDQERIRKAKREEELRRIRAEEAEKQAKRNAKMKNAIVIIGIVLAIVATIVIGGRL